MGREDDRGGRQAARHALPPSAPGVLVNGRLATGLSLAWKLKDRGVATIVSLHDQDQPVHRSTPCYVWGFSFRDLLACLIKRAAVVVANDSFPAHFSGTLGVPTLALMGPTRATVFAHIPEVVCLSSTAGLVNCTGCHFGPPFSPGL